MISESIYWHQTAAMPGDTALAPLPESVDVAVIGGGYTGLSAARTLARRGVSVAVLETHTIGWGASSRNGGMVLTGLKLPMQQIVRRHGLELAKRMFQASLDSIDAVERLVDEERIDCGFARSGHLLVANRPSHYGALEQEAEFMARQFGHAVHLVSRTGLEAEIGSQIYHGALVDARSGGLNPAQYVAGLARAAETAGAVLCARARVHRLERSATGFRLETERGPVRARQVLAATSGYTGPVTPHLQRRIVPVGSFIIATEPLPAPLAAQISPRGRMIFDSRHYLNYYRLWDSRLIFGGRAAFFPENSATVRQSAEILRREMIGIFPQLGAVRVEHAWGGTLDFAFDLQAHVGELNGVFFALGYAGHGVAMATYLGQTLAECMLSGGLEQHPFAALPFPRAPLGAYDGRPWFLPLAGLWYRLLDLVE
jgi:glycine/D-amino acid oxidase-like deaminating enzyme